MRSPPLEQRQAPGKSVRSSSGAQRGERGCARALLYTCNTAFHSLWYFIGGVEPCGSGATFCTARLYVCRMQSRTCVLLGLTSASHSSFPPVIPHVLKVYTFNLE